MDSQPEEHQSDAPPSNLPNESDTHAFLYQLVSHIDAESCTQEVVDSVQELNLEETQLLVDCLSMALEKNAVVPKNRSYVWRSLVKVASSAKLFARSHTLDSKRIATGGGTSLDVYEVSGESPVRVKVVKRYQNDDAAFYSDGLITWAHLSHPNILPLYAAFLENEQACLVFPAISNGNVCDFVREHHGVPLMPMISDIVNGLCYIHPLGIVHGGLNPESVLISDDGRVLITDLDTTSETQGSFLSLARYSAPELLGEDDIQPTTAADIWSFACLCYELLSGKIPFYQIVKDFRVSGAVAKGSKPIRPGQGGMAGNEIGDAIWQLMLMCWEYEPKDRPCALKIKQVLLGMDIQDTRPKPSSMISPEVTKGSTIDLECAKTSLARVIGSDHPSSLRVPEHLRNLLSKLVPDPNKFNATVAAANKFCPGATQTFVDFLDLVLEDLPDLHQDPVLVLLSKLMTSTHILPQRYKLHRVQYHPTPLAEGSFGKIYKGHYPEIRVHVVTNPSVVRKLIRDLPDWFYSSHPNIVPFHGVFYEGTVESPRVCVVTPLWKNGSLRDFAPTLPQKSRKLLLSDVVNGMAYLHGVGLVCSDDILVPEIIHISDEGRAILTVATNTIYQDIDSHSSPRKLRFSAEDAPSGYFFEDDLWSYGCICYEVLSRKPPYFQYEEGAEIRSAVSRGELPIRPECTNQDMDEIDDQFWDLITKCCVPARWDRITAPQTQELFRKFEMEDNRPEVKRSSVTDVMVMKSRPNVDFHHVETLLEQIRVELLRKPLSKLVQYRIKDVATSVAELDPDDTRTMVDFLDMALKDYLSISEERNRVLALLSRVTSSTRIFPRRYELKGIKYCSTPIAEGGYGTVHRGTDLNVCVKVMSRVDQKALTPWIKELILWAHSSHPNILPFFGVLLEVINGIQRICLVSPFMKNGNLHDYAPKIPQKSRLPLILDVINGLYYLHGLGIIHSDLKGENVLISNEGRGLITDFGTTQISTATAATTGLLVPSTIRFAAPEVVLCSGLLTKERDIWSFGCLCYEVLSRKLPYYQYRQNIQVSAALARKELPKRPGSTISEAVNGTDEDHWDDDDDDDEEDWDTINDQAWDLITKCCAPEPDDRLKIPAIQELIADMKVWDDRPPVQALPEAEISKLRSTSEIDLNRVGELLDQVQVALAPIEQDAEQSFVDLFNDI